MSNDPQAFKKPRQLLCLLISCYTNSRLLAPTSLLPMYRPFMAPQILSRI